MRESVKSNQPKNMRCTLSEVEIRWRVREGEIADHGLAPRIRLVQEHPVGKGADGVGDLNCSGFSGERPGRSRAEKARIKELRTAPSSAFVKVGDGNAILWLRYRSCGISNGSGLGDPPQWVISDSH